MSEDISGTEKVRGYLLDLHGREFAAPKLTQWLDHRRSVGDALRRLRDPVASSWLLMRVGNAPLRGICHELTTLVHGHLIHPDLHRVWAATWSHGDPMTVRVLERLSAVRRAAAALEVIAGFGGKEDDGPLFFGDPRMTVVRTVHDHIIEATISATRAELAEILHEEVARLQIDQAPQVATARIMTALRASGWWDMMEGKLYEVAGERRASGAGGVP
jgi:hypothetical protein